VGHSLPQKHLGVEVDQRDRVGTGPPKPEPEAGQTAEALRESEERFRQLAEAIDGVFWMSDPQKSEVLYVSPAYQQLWGRSCQSLYEQPRSFLDAVHPEDREHVRVASLERQARGEGGDVEYRVVRPDGSVCWVRDRSFPVKDPAGRVYRMAGFAEDITEQKAVAESLRASEQRFKEFMDHSPAIVWIKDEAGRYVYVNRTFERVLRRTLGDMHGRDDFELWPPDMAAEFRRGDRRVLATGEPLESVDVGPGGDGTRRHWHVHKFLVRDAAGAPYVAGIGVDVTERKRAEERLQETAQRLQSLSRRLLEVQEQERRHLARELHDEVGQALTGFKLTLGACRASLPGEPPGCWAEAEGLLGELTARVRDLSLRLRPSMLDDLGLLSALLWLLERYTAQTGVRVDFEHRGLERRLPPEVETAAYQVVQEALTNVARHAGVGECQVRLWLDEGALHVQVEDRGAGFDPALARGASTGLSGMEERALLLGGALRVESAPGAGTRVVAELPVRPVGEPRDAGP
jgi:PAS domain S-box-containing protein